MLCCFAVCGAAGVVIGTVLSGLIGEGIISIVAVVFFAASNAAPDDAVANSTLGLVCSALGVLMGYGIGSVGRQGWHLCSAAEWNEDEALPFRMPLFLILVTIFHAAEFLFTVAYHRQSVEFRAFLLTPVPYGGYSIAMITAIAEFWVEHSLLGGIGMPLPNTVGLSLLAFSFGLAFCGWALRTAALFTARSNFTHLVAWRKATSHQLVTHGVYKLCRHPGYVGWFLWSVSSQLVLGNPLCLLAYGYVSWKFFAGRIPGEEELLISFFGEEYEHYARNVPCGLPFISRLP
mmetsp:Transcript_88093/g.174829  ORF Transcript_88093/g.174829 Transcript_88093/m.174829 type:complete len:290 (-) Transcript_88093:12-881(-)